MDNAKQVNEEPLLSSITHKLCLIEMPKSCSVFFLPQSGKYLNVIVKQLIL